MLVTTYARPRYGEMDPTWLIALTYPLLFGAMFGDVGHGLLLAVLGLLLSSKKIKALRGLSGLGGLLTVCGMVAGVFGFLYGSIFGFEEILHAAWLQPGHDPLRILIVAIGADVILLSIGFVIGIFNGIVSRDWGHLLFGHGGIAAAVLYWSLLAMGAALGGLLPGQARIPGVIAVVAGLCIMFSSVLIRLVEGEPSYGSSILAGTVANIFRSTNNGSSWELSNTGLTNVYIYTLVVKGAKLFEGTGGSGIFMTTNNGINWVPVNSGLTNAYTGTNFIFSMIVVGNNIFAGIRGGGVFMSTNEGSNWLGVNNGIPSSVDVKTFAASGSNIFAGTANQGVYLTTNNGANWTQVNSGLGSLTVNALMVKGSDVYCGTTGGGVCKSTNNGTNWVPVNSGMSNTCRRMTVTGAPAVTR